MCRIVNYLLGMVCLFLVACGGGADDAITDGNPVVVSDIPGSGAGWVVRQAGHGLLVPPGDPAALAQALRELQRDPIKRQALGQSGATALRERFGIGRVAAAIGDLYRRLLAAG